MARSAAERKRDEQRVEKALLGELLPRHDRRLHCKVAGVMHRNEDGSSRQDAIAKLAQFDELVLKRAPEDEYDGNAIAVLAMIAGGLVQIGFVPADLAGDLARKIDAGERWAGIATRVSAHISKGVDAMLYRLS